MYYVYIITNKRNGTLYVGMTDNLKRRVYEHKNNIVKGFSSKYSLHTLVYYEVMEEVMVAIEREKRLKKWNRLWKLRLIKEKNPEWNDLYHELEITFKH